MVSASPLAPALASLDAGVLWFGCPPSSGVASGWPLARDRAVALDEVVAARAAAGMPPTRVARFPGTGHNLMRYRPAEVAAELVALAASARVRMAPWTSS
jgi:pimeloyl-ACP methyl ester carboxylesterase